MACQCAPALIKLRDEVNKRWPNRDKSSDGCCASAKHTTQNPTSDHEPYNGYAHALDIDEDLDAETHSLKFLLPALLADSRTRYVIYEGRIFYPGGISKAYTGTNPHDKHLHISIQRTATFETRSWLVTAPEPVQPPDEEDDMPLPKATYVKVKGSPAVYVAGLSVDPRQVERYRDLDYHLAKLGGVEVVKPTDLGYPAAACDEVADDTGERRLVLIVDDGSLFGL